MNCFYNSEGQVFEKTISVIIPSYNSGAFIGDTIRSVVRAAENHDHEIIIVDDCSDDIELLRNVVAQFPQAFLVEKDRKSNAAISRNIGIGKACGKYVFLLDSDDHFEPDYVEHRLRMMEAGGYEFVFGSYINVTSYNESVVCEVPRGIDPRDFLFIEDKDIRTSTISFTGHKKESFRFNESLEKHQDWAFLIDTLEQCTRWAYDVTPGVKLNCVRDSRMSGAMNIKASQYFISNYLDDGVHVSGFCKRHFVLAALVENEEAYRYFSSLVMLSRIKSKYKAIKLVGDFMTGLGLFPLLSRSLFLFRSLVGNFVRK
ncbi:glycosyl transferase family 2 [Kushneria sinocarnis]|uniref:Glycosyl transferase family 2 n=1 Tax=Kushneria sinocarnis TaxID=595502 RepID=A0A420WXU4_9GAMM|nr:glycosyltransferase family 2 protein [Kushneria sinocarnis]RKR06049.1 glycosyl transferase family 2 [Kushneria sinocarnis]